MSSLGTNHSGLYSKQTWEYFMHCAVALSSGGVCTVGGSKGKDKCKSACPVLAHMFLIWLLQMFVDFWASVMYYYCNIRKLLTQKKMICLLSISSAIRLWISDAHTLTTGFQMIFFFFLANSISLGYWSLSCSWSCVEFRNVLKTLCFSFTLLRLLIGAQNPYKSAFYGCH